MRTPLLTLVLLVLAGGAGGARAEERAPLARVLVEGDGFVRVPAASLAKLGFGPDDDVRVSRRGKAAPQLPRAGNDGDVVFLALDTEGPHTRSAVYRIARAAPGSSPLAQGRTDPIVVVPRAPPEVVRAARQDRRFADLAAAEREVYDAPAPTWFVAGLAARNQVEIAVPAGSDGPQQLLVWLHATQPGEIVMQAEHAGHDLGVARAAFAPAGVLLRWHVPQPEPGQPVVLRDLSPAVPAPPRDVSDARGSLWIDHVTWTGRDDAAHLSGLVAWHDPVAAVALRLPAGTDVALLQVADDGTSLGPPFVLTGLRGLEPDQRAVAGVAGPRPSWMFAGPVRRLDPEPLVVPPAPWPDLDGVEHLIVTTQALREEAERLARHRNAAGLVSRVLVARDVYAALADGEEDPQVLRRFLGDLRRRPEGRALRYVLLCGDAALDRSDLLAVETLPALMARTQYNGATPADTLYVEGDGDPEVAPPVVGRLPFREPAELARFVDRLIAYETPAVTDASRRTLRFLASEGRFGAVADAMIEGFFKRIVGREIPPAFDVEITFASATSSFVWPPQEFNAKVIEGINQGSVFYTYVGHGFAQGFDSLHVGEQRFPILHVGDAEQVNVRGTPPVIFAIACTTAQFDAPKGVGLGERLISLPNGPIAYGGATRICHPAANAFLGRSLARAMFRPGAAGTRRLGDVLAAARAEVLDPSRDDKTEVALLTMGTKAMLPKGTSLERLKQEALWLYNLLGDPGTALALPEIALDVTAERDGEGIQVAVRGLPDGTEVALALELPRERMHPDRAITRGVSLTDPAQSQTLRTNHRHANDKRVVSGVATVREGVARAQLAPPAGARPLSDPAFGGAYVVKAHAVSAGRVGVGAARLVWDVSSPDGDGTPR